MLWRPKTYHEKIILLSLCDLVLLPLVDAVRLIALPSLMTFMLSVFAASSELLLLPLPDEAPRFSFVSVNIILFFHVVSYVLAFSEYIMVVGVLVWVVLHFFHKAKMRFSKIRPLFKQHCLLYFMNCHSNYLFAMVLMLLAYGICFSEGKLWHQIFVLSLQLFFYCLLMLKAYSGRLLLMSRKAEQEFRKMLMALAADRPQVEIYDDSGAHPQKSIQVLYAQMVEYMMAEKPFLDQNFTIQDLATKLCTNKTYASKTINLVTRNNFRTFVNNFRVEHSIELMRTRPNLRISEIVELSGFNNRNTFACAFKQKTGMLPGEYQQRLRYDRSFIEDPSTNLRGRG